MIQRGKKWVKVMQADIKATENGFGQFVLQIGSLPTDGLTTETTDFCVELDWTVANAFCVGLLCELGHAQYIYGLRCKKNVLDMEQFVVQGNIRILFTKFVDSEICSSLLLKVNISCITKPYCRSGKDTKISNTPIFSFVRHR